MSICVIAEEFDSTRGGSIDYVEYISYLKEKYSVFVLYNAEYNNPTYDEDVVYIKYGMKVIHKTYFFNFLQRVINLLFLFHSLHKLIRSTQIDVLFTHNWLPLIPVFFCSKLFHIVAIYDFRSLGPKNVWRTKFGSIFGYLLVWIKQVLFRFLDDSAVFTCNSDYVKDNLEEYSKSRIHFLYSPISPPKKLNDEFCAQLKKLYKPDDSSILLLSIGALVVEKGTGYLIAAFRRVMDIHPDIKLVLIGDGPERTILMELVKKNNLDDDVIFLLNKSHHFVWHILEISDLYILPSLTESFSRSIVEAIMLNKRIISTNVGGMYEVNKLTTKYMLIKPKNICELTNAMEKSIELLGSDLLSDKLNVMNRHNPINVKNSLFELIEMCIID